MGSVYDGYVEDSVLYFKSGFFFVKVLLRFNEGVRFFVSLDWQETIA